MGDVDRGGVELFDDLAHRQQNFDLSCHVQRGGGFVKHNQIGTRGHGHCCHNALKLSTGHLMRIALTDRVMVRQLERLIQFARVVFGRFFTVQPVHHGGFNRLVNQPVGRIERGRRRLCNIGHTVAP